MILTLWQSSNTKQSCHDIYVFSPPPWKNEFLKIYQEYLLNTYTRYQAKSVVVVLGIFLWLMVLVVREWPSITFAGHVMQPCSFLKQPRLFYKRSLVKQNLT